MEEKPVEEELEIALKAKELEKVYLKVVKKFPRIKEEEIDIIYCPLDDTYARTSIIDPNKFLYENKVVIDPILYIGSKFFELNNQEKETIIAHELGHYNLCRNYSLGKIKRRTKWCERLKDYNKKSLEEGMILFSDKNEKHKIERLQKWNLIHELHADNEAKRAGYGAQIIFLLEKIVEKHPNRLSQETKEEIRIRMERLRGVI